MKFVRLPYGYPDTLSPESVRFVEAHCQHLPYEACNAKLIAMHLGNGASDMMTLVDGTLHLGHDVLHAAARGAKEYGNTFVRDLIKNVDGTGTMGPIGKLIQHVVGG